MKLDINMGQEFNEYLYNISKTNKQFYEDFNQIKEKYSKKIAYEIVDKMHELGTFTIPNDMDIKEKIDRKIEPMVDEYDSELMNYLRLNSDIINNSVSEEDKHLYVMFPELGDKLLENKLEEREEDDIANSILRSIVDTVLTHIAFRNQNNPNYPKNLYQLEGYVREVVNKHMSRFNKDITELYNMTVKILNDQSGNLILGLQDIYLKQNNDESELQDINSENNKRFK